MESVRIILLAVGAAVSYGVLHDQVTARVCVEYFTIAHPPVFGTDDPTLLGLGWGVIATWWVGLVLGVFLAISARAGRRPKLAWKGLLRPLGILLLVMAVLASTAGVLAYASLRDHPPGLPPGLEAVPEERRAAFIADWMAHTTSYAAGSLGGLTLCVWTWFRRRRPPRPWSLARGLGTDGTGRRGVAPRGRDLETRPVLDRGPSRIRTNGHSIS